MAVPRLPSAATRWRRRAPCCDVWRPGWLDDGPASSGARLVVNISQVDRAWWQIRYTPKVRKLYSPWRTFVSRLQTVPNNHYSASRGIFHFSPSRQSGRAVNHEFEIGASTTEFETRSSRTPARTPVNMSEASTREDREFARERRGPKPNRGGSGRFPSRSLSNWRMAESRRSQRM